MLWPNTKDNNDTNIHRNNPNKDKEKTTKYIERKWTNTKDNNNTNIHRFEINPKKDKEKNTKYKER